MFPANGGQNLIRREIFAGHPSDPGGDVWQFRVDVRHIGVDHEARRIDDRLAKCNMLRQVIAEDARRRQIGIVVGRHIEAHGAGKFAFNVDAEYPRVVEIVESIAQTPRKSRA